jgi:hypothetical protein
VFNRDYAVVQGVVLTTATIYITLNLIADIAYILVNPAAEGVAMTDARSALPVAVSDELESPARRALRRLFKRKGAVSGLVVIALFLLLALFAPLIVPYDPIATSWSLVRKPPTWQHWFGTDDLGPAIFWAAWSMARGPR